MNVVFTVWEWIAFLLGLAGATAATASLIRPDDQLERAGRYGFLSMWCAWWTFVILLVARGA